MRAAPAFADATRPLRFGIDDARLAALFPELDRSARAAARHATWSTYLRNEALGAALTSDSAPRGTRELVDAPGPGELAGPCVIVSFHVGPYWVIGAVLDADRQRRARLQPRRRRGPRRDHAAQRRRPAARASTFLRTVRDVRRGAGVFALADAGERGTLELA